MNAYLGGRLIILAGNTTMDEQIRVTEFTAKTRTSLEELQRAALTCTRWRESL